LKKKILIVTRNLPPLIGGMERLNWHIADELSKTHKVELLSYSDARNQAPKNCYFHGIPLNPLYFFLILAFVKTFWICLTKHPDILFAGSGLTAPITTFWSKVFRIKSIVYVHGLDIATNHTIYNIIWLPMIRAADCVIANSTPTRDICLKKGISVQKLSIICPGVTSPPLPKNHDFIQLLQEKYHLHDKKILISVGRLTQRKGLNEFVDLALPKIVKNIPNTLLVVIGDTPSHSLNKNLQSKELILATAAKHHITENILFVGNISDDHILSSWYYLADLHVFPVKYIPNDPEGFGMVAIEAAAHGTPTIAFATGGIVDAVSNAITGKLILMNDYQSFSKTVIFTLENPEVLNKENCQESAKKFSWENVKTRLNLLIQELNN